MLTPPAQAQTIEATVVIHRPDAEPDPASTVVLTTECTRQQVASNRRCSIYKHTVTIAHSQFGEETLHEEVKFVSRSHPPADPLDYLGFILRNTRSLRSHLSGHPRRGE
jgi:hypothetical protein